MVKMAAHCPFTRPLTPPTELVICDARSYKCSMPVWQAAAAGKDIVLALCRDFTDPWFWSLLLFLSCYYLFFSDVWIREKRYLTSNSAHGNGLMVVPNVCMPQSFRTNAVTERTAHEWKTNINHKSSWNCWKIRYVSPFMTMTSAKANNYIVLKQLYYYYTCTYIDRIFTYIYTYIHIIYTPIFTCIYIYLHIYIAYIHLILIFVKWSSTSQVTRYMIPFTRIVFNLAVFLGGLPWFGLESKLESPLSNRYPLLLSIPRSPRYIMIWKWYCKVNK